MRFVDSRTAMLLVALIPLGILAAWTSKHLTQYEIYPSFDFTRQALVAIWADTGRVWRTEEFPRTSIIKLDLLTGETSKIRASYYYMQWVDIHGISYEIVPTAKAGKLIARDTKTNATRDIGALPYAMPLDELFLDRYLIGVESGQITAVDTQTVDAEGNVHLMRIAVAGSSLGMARLFAIEDTPYFVCRCTGLTPPTTKVYTIEAGLIKEVASWTEGGVTPKATLNGQEILNLAADGKAIEVRKPPTFEVSQRRPAPIEMLTNWANVIDERSTITVLDPTVRKYTSYRTADFARIPELDGLRHGFQDFWYQKPGRNTLTFFKRPGPNVDLTVYDAIAEKTVAQLEFSQDYSDVQQVSDHHFAVVDSRLGGTITVYELPGAKVVAIHRPMLWPLIGVIALVASVLLWCALWLRNSQRLHRHQAVDWLVLACVLVLPALYRLIAFDQWYSTWRFPLAVVQAGVATSLFALSSYWLYGRARWPYRMLAWTSMLCLVTLGISLLEHFWGSYPKEFPGQALLHFAFVAMLGFVAGPLSGKNLHSAIRTPATEHRSSRVYMLDWFWMTAAVGVAILVYTPIKDAVKLAIQQDLTPVIIVSLQVVAVQIVAARLVLSRRTVVHRLGLALAVLAGLVLVGNWIIVLLASDLVANSYLMLTMLRLIALVYLLTTAWCSRTVFQPVRVTP